MTRLEHVGDIAKRLQALVGEENLAFLNLLETPPAPIDQALAALADSDAGGLLMVLGDETLFTDRGDCILDRLGQLFPIVESHTAQAAEGWLWTAAVAGTRDLPESCGAASDLLRVAEFAPLCDADVRELDLRALTGRDLEGDALRPDAVLKTILRGRKNTLWGMGIATIRHERLVPTVAGMLALGRHPYRHLPGMCVELDIGGERACWRGSLRDLEARAGSVTSPYLLPGRQKFRALFMNALLHRGWRQADRRLPIRIHLSDGMLEITHPGLQTDWRTGQSTPVNPRLFALARYLKLATGTGAGLELVDRYLVKRELRPLELASTGEGVRLRIPWPFRPKDNMVQPAAQPGQAPKVSSTQPPSREVSDGLQAREDMPQGPASRSVPAVHPPRGEMPSRPVPAPSSAVQPPPRGELSPRPVAPEVPAVHPPRGEIARHSAPATPLRQAPPPEARPLPKASPPNPPAQTGPQERQADSLRPRELPGRTVPISPPSSPAPRAPAPEAATATPNPGSRGQAVLELLRRRGPLTTQQLMQSLGWTRWATRTALEGLVESRMVRTAAASPRSPLQAYELA